MPFARLSPATSPAVPTLLPTVSARAATEPTAARGNEPHLSFLASQGRVGDNNAMQTVANQISDFSDSKSRRKGKIALSIVDDLRRRVASGEWSIAEGARRLGRSETAVRRMVRGTRSYKDADAPTIDARGACGRPPRISPETVRAIHAAKGKESRSVVATRLGISPRYVTKIWSGDARLDVEPAPAATVENAEVLS